MVCPFPEQSWGAGGAASEVWREGGGSSKGWKREEGRSVRVWEGLGVWCM